MSSSDCTDSHDYFSQFSQLAIAPDRSSGWHPVFSHICWMYVLNAWSMLVCPCFGVHDRTSLISLSILLKVCSTNLVLSWMTCEMRDRKPYNCFCVGCCFQDKQISDIYYYRLWLTVQLCLCHIQKNWNQNKRNIPNIK